MKLFKKWEENANYYIPLILICLFGGILYVEEENKPYPLLLKILIFVSIILCPLVLSPLFYDYFREKKGLSAAKEIIQYGATMFYLISIVWWAVIFFGKGN